MYGEVLEGVLAEDVDLPYEAGTPQNSLKPTAMSDVPLQFVFIPTYTDAMPTNRLLPFKGGTKVIFNDFTDAQACPSFVEFKARKPMPAKR
jgi:hypothetical protein